MCFICVPLKSSIGVVSKLDHEFLHIVGEDFGCRDVQLLVSTSRPIPHHQAEVEPFKTPSWPTKNFPWDKLLVGFPEWGKILNELLVADNEAPSIVLELQPHAVKQRGDVLKIADLLLRD
jgi:hypothetical protein